MQKWQTEKHRLGHGIQIPFFSGITEIVLNVGNSDIQYSIQSIPHIE